MTHRVPRSAPKPRAVIGTPWVVRKAIYLVATLVGLAAVVLGWAQPDQVDQWVAQAGSLAAIIGGGMAAMNTGWESDEKPVGVDVAAAPAPAYEPEPVYDGFTAYPDEVQGV
ncbi:hypothetical protein [Corynebacterium sp. p3-SID1194]|uniref:hypothetical protein n=1 Tax=Corynebacterium sp. p3-SID1194 TaxID=2916105 RepID=UPI0021A8DF98|nr:hypothetical protein [Corynebacterium sp. p3-SID1194]MCT1450656.1 hypothetical protein [Corynebacterium sp. p3-SID1194]